jgi:2-polyprenyl-3-methyl-5-hydroxy-6-metoxy-1,4-benzoquinol methylase
MSKLFNKSILVQLFGFGATLLHGELLVLDRWRWVKKRLPVTHNSEKLVDIGCASGAFTIGAALRGYEAVGLSWDKRDLNVALERAKLCGANNATFSVQDLRLLDQRIDLRERFDVAVCCEVIEHVLNDRKLMVDISNLLKPGGILLLTTPYYFYPPINEQDMGPFVPYEDGRHVRRGYTRTALVQLCTEAGFLVEEFGACSGFFSQKITRILRSVRPYILGWFLTLPLRVVPIALDHIVTALTGWTDYSICLVAYKPIRNSALGSLQNADFSSHNAIAPATEC